MIAALLDKRDAAVARRSLRLYDCGNGSTTATFDDFDDDTSGLMEKAVGNIV